MTKHARSTNDRPMKSNKAAVPVEHAQPGPDGYKCQSADAKFPGERAASDARVSTDAQAEQEKDSLPSQQKATQADGDRLELNVVYESIGAVSGADEKAKRIRDFIALAEAGIIQHILFSTFDRAFRSAKLAENFVDHMRELGVHVWVEGRCIAHAGAHANAMNQMRHLMSEHERNVLQERANRKVGYARAGTSYRRIAPPGFTLVPIPNTKKARRLAVIAEEKSLLHAIFIEVSCSGVHFAYASPLGEELRQKYPQIQCPQDLANFIIRDRAYLGLNTHGAFAFETPYTPENRVVSEDLFRNANQKLQAAPRRRASLGEVASKIGAITLLDGLLEHVVVLCRKCLAPMHRGRLQEHQGLVCPTLECRGTPLDFEELARFQKQRGVEVGDFDAALRPKGDVHESVLVSAAQQQDARASLYRCDNCLEVRLSHFIVTRCGARVHLWCKSCGTGRMIPRPPWQVPPAKRPFKQSLAPWVSKPSRGTRKGNLSDEHA